MNGAFAKECAMVCSFGCALPEELATSVGSTIDIFPELGRGGTLEALGAPNGAFIYRLNLNDRTNMSDWTSRSNMVKRRSSLTAGEASISARDTDLYRGIAPRSEVMACANIRLMVAQGFLNHAGPIEKLRGWVMQISSKLQK